MCSDPGLGAVAYSQSLVQGQKLVPAFPWWAVGKAAQVLVVENEKNSESCTNKNDKGIHPKRNGRMQLASVTEIGVLCVQM